MIACIQESCLYASRKEKLYGVAWLALRDKWLPADARDELGIKTGDKLYVANAGKGGLYSLKRIC